MYCYMNELPVKELKSKCLKLKNCQKSIDFSKLINSSNPLEILLMLSIPLSNDFLESQLKIHEERWNMMETFRKSDVKKELMEKMFHPKNIHKFKDWGFIEENDI